MRRFLTRALLAMVPLVLGVGHARAQTSPFTIDVFGQPNWANTKPLHKFVDQLPGLGYANRNGLGQYIPIATPVVNPAFPNDDYYEIGVVEYREQMHSDLPSTGTKLRGYVDLHGSDPTGNAKPHYLGPLIIAKRDKPVRLKYVNQLPANSKLFLPVDKTLMGAGMGPLGMNVPAGLQMDYSENRAEVHLHGGFTPWISDGTPHQWVTPTAESTPYRKGAVFQNIPDMLTGAEADNDASGTLYYTNQQSGRLMFYHDHSYGITRLNVYGGEAAGYLLVDPVEDTLINNNVIPGKGMGVYTYGIPLVIQDKTFVTTTATDPNRNTLATDPTWATAVPGSQDGDLWFPHVYTPNQDPASPDGANPFGRWDYGPWFWPPWVVNQGQEVVPEISAVPEGFMDTPIVNGTAYPYLNVQPQAYRFRILNACNDRMLNLQLYQADTGGGGTGATATATVAGGSVTALQLTSGGGGYASAPGVYITGGGGFGASADTTVVGGVVTGIVITNPGFGYTSAPTVTIGMASEVKMVPAVANATPNWPATWPTDGRDGGVPDPNTAGPAMVQIGSEGGLLPAPVVLPNTPVGYNYNRRDIVVLNVADHTLWMGPAERADVIIDFSQYAGKTVILYNDMAAPVPAFDPRFDYYTFDPDWSYTATDLTGYYSGGAPSTMPGFGPNTRTIMQFRVANATPAAAFDPTSTAFVNAMTAAYAASQPPPLVPQSTYPAPNKAQTNTYAHITDTSLTYASVGPQTIQSIAVTGRGRFYTVAPTVNIIGGGGTGATATATISAGQVTAVTLTNPGSGYTSAPQITFTSNEVYPTKKGTGASAIAMTSNTVKIDFKPKCIQELFDTWGRMNATLGTEIPNTNGTTQTTIPLGYVDPATETVPDGETQIWKITHNGVDTHAIHWHLINVQVINRVGWDGAIRPPEATELGWKETVKMNPLEDIIVAVRATAPARLPFGVADSVRLLDPTMPENSTFPSLDPLTGGAVTITNTMTNFGWEYVWHCHLLGHEENDMMRPMIMTEPFVTRPTAPNNLTATLTGFQVNLHWNDRSNNEWGFRIERNVSGSNVWALVDTAPINATSYVDLTAAASTAYTYRVRSVNKAGISAPSNTRNINTPVDRPITTATITPALNAAGWVNTDVSVTLNSTSSVGTTIKSILYQVDANGWVTTNNVNTVTFPVTGAAQHIIQFYAIDNLNHAEPTNLRHINIDKTAPVTTESTSPSPNLAGWNNTNVTVNLTGTDNVTAITYTIDGGTPVAVGGATTSFPLTTNGVHTISAYSTDLAGNVESPAKTFTISIDKTAPTSAATVTPAPNAAGWNNSDVTVSMSSTDNAGGSGVATISYSLDNASPIAVAGSTTSVTVTTEGSHSVAFYSTDLAGNVETTKVVTFKIDKTAPVTTGTPTPAANGAGWNNTNVSVALSSTDTGTSGVKSITYTLDGTPTTVTGSTANVSITAEGTHTLIFGATDVAGNVEATTTLTVKIDKTAPGPTTCTLGTTTATLTSSDAISGLLSITYSLDAGPATQYTTPIDIGYTAHTLTYFATDNAGNVETTKTTNITDRRTSSSVLVMPVTGDAGRPVQLDGVLYITGTTQRIAGKTLHFLIGGAEIGSGVTDAGGHAYCTYSIPVGSPTSIPVSISFLGDASYFASQGAGTLTVNPTISTSILVMPVSGDAGRTVQLDGVLYVTGTIQRIAGRTLHFFIGGVEVGSGTTDAGGHAYFAYAIPIGSPPTVTVTTKFLGDSSYTASQNTGTLTVSPTVSTSILVMPITGIAGQAVQLDGVLYITGTTQRVAGRTLHFFIGGVEVGSGVTDIGGHAYSAYTIPLGSPSTIGVTAQFLGDTSYTASQGTGTLTVM